MSSTSASSDLTIEGSGYNTQTSAIGGELIDCRSNLQITSTELTYHNYTTWTTTIKAVHWSTRQ